MYVIGERIPLFREISKVCMLHPGMGALRKIQKLIEVQLVSFDDLEDFIV